jgi:hypothetical protein
VTVADRWSLFRGTLMIETWIWDPKMVVAIYILVYAIKGFKGEKFLDQPLIDLRLSSV